LAVLISLVVAACGGRQTAQPPADEGTPAESPSATGFAPDCVETTRVEAQDHLFQPVCLIISPGDSVTVRNTGDATHNFKIPNTSINSDVAPGEQVVVKGVGDVVEPGIETEFTCRFHGGMGGYINVA
jgi:plastocyanin